MSAAVRTLASLPRRAQFTVASGLLGSLGSRATSVRDNVVVEEFGTDGDGLVASHHLIKWLAPPRNILVMQKPGDPMTDVAFTKVATLLNRLGKFNVVVEPHVAASHSRDLPDLVSFDAKDPLDEHIDVVIALGGDGTLLHVSSLFQQAVPPVLSFALGSLGFLMPFSMNDCETTLSSSFSDYVPFVPRIRLQCIVHSPRSPDTQYHVMNEVSLHRGREPSLAFLDIQVDGEPLTSTLADGIIVATPTGSTAYSLSAGGPVVHPNVKSILITPICPRSLSFRPVLLPVDVEVLMRLSAQSRGAAEASFDGRKVVGLQPNDYITVRTSKYPVPTLSRKPTSTADWVHDITSLLKWNQKWGHN